MNELPSGFTLDEPSAPAGFKLDDLPSGFTLDPQIGVGERAAAYGKRFVQGAKNLVGGAMQGISEALPEDEGNVFRQRAGRLLQEGKPYEEATAIAADEQTSGQQAAPTSPTQTSLYKAGTAINEFGKDYLTAGPAGEGFIGDLAEGAGSMVGGMVMGGLPKAGTALAGTSFVGSGAGEAAERARKAGATDEQTLQAARQGIVPGLTDLADVELAKRAMGSGTLTQRLVRGLITGGIVEGTQEGVQQFMQNMIARGIYKPDQDVWEGVAYNALLGAVLGGGAKATIEGVTGGRTTEPATTPSPSLFGITPAGAATRIQTPPPTATPTPVPPGQNNELPPAMGGPPLTEGELDGLRLEREIRRQELQTLDIGSPEFQHAVGRLKDISLQLQGAEQNEAAVVPIEPEVVSAPASNVVPFPAAPPSNYIDQISSGAVPLPTTEELSTTISTTERGDLEQSRASGLTEEEHKRLLVLNRKIDQGSDEAIREKNALLAKTRNLPDSDTADAETLRQLRLEFQNLEPQPGETPKEHQDGIVRVLNRYVGKVIEGDVFARGVFKKAMYEARQANLDTRQITQEVLNRYLSSISSESDREFMRQEFANFFRSVEGSATTISIAPSPLHVLTQRRLDAFDDLKNAARSGNLDAVRTAKAALAQIETEWAAAMAGTQPEPSDDPNAPQREAWHGSPVKHSGFQAEYLRTGEGNMVKGSGFYFAEARQVSESYTRLEQAQKIANLFVKRAEGSRIVAARQLRDTLSRAAEGMRRDYQNALDIVEGREPENTLYHVNIAAEKEHLLDFDAEWGKQSAGVREALTRLRKDPVFAAKEKADIRGGASWRGQTGEAIYNEISRILRGGKESESALAQGDHEASNLLLKYGIPGSMFLDQFSRRGLTRADLQKQLDVAYGEAAKVATGVAFGQGVAVGRHIADLERQAREAPEELTRNFVIFDPRKITILTRNGEPIIGAQTIDTRPIRQAAGGPTTVAQTAQRAIHYGNLHLAVYDVATKEVHVSRPVSLIGEVPQNLIPADNVILHDDTIIEFAPGNQKMFSEIGQERFGKRFDEYNYGVGEVFKGLRERVAALMPNGQYKGILSEAVGVSFGFGYRNQGIPVPGIAHGGGWHGVSFKKFPFSGYFVNSFLAHLSQTPEEVATSLMTTMVHEFAHHTERSETVGHGPFAHAMQAIQIRLATDPTRAYEKLKKALTLHVRDHWDVYTEMERIPHVHDVRPLSSSSLWGTSPQSARNASIPRNNGGLGFGGGERPATGGGVRPGAPGAGAVGDDGGVSVSYPGYATERDLGTSTNQRALSAVGASREVPAVPIQPATAGIRSGLQKLFAGSGGGASRGAGQPPGGATTGGGTIGGLPPTVAAAAAQADSMNWFWKYWYGLDQAADNNTNFPPILRYREDTQRMHLEESKVHDMSLTISKKWSRITPAQNAALTSVLHDAAQMTYLSAQEKAAKVVRRPTQQEEQALFQQHKLKPKAQQIYREVNGSFDLFLDAIAKNAREEVQRNVSDPVKYQSEMKKIADQVLAVKGKPFFPYRRFGSHYVTVKGSSGHLVLMETFERRGVLPAQYFQRKRAGELAKQFPGHEIVKDAFPAEVDPLVGMPGLLLQSLQGQMTMTPAQMKSAQLLQMTSARYFASRFKGSALPGFSMDFLRSYSKFFFHAGRYYAHTKYAWRLRGNIQMARAVQTNKASALADYMEDHLKNTILDVRGDFGKLKGFIFLYGLGYSPAAATANMTQLPMVVLPLFNAKFGMTKGAPALLKAMGQLQNYYKRGAYAGQTDFVSRALEYGIQTGRITEAQAPELAGLSMANNLNNSVLGTKAQRGWKFAFEKSAWLFEMSEQMVRRVTYRAALDLALKNPNSKATREAVKLHSQEVLQLQAKFSPAEARAIVTAGYMTETPNFIYAKWARPRAFRHPVASVVLVFQKYMQSLLTLMKTHPTDFLPQYLLISMFLYGLGGVPGSDDLIDLVKALASRWFGKNYNLEAEARKYVLELSGGKVEPDLILHGVSRKGWGLPALVDLMGEKPGRGLMKDFQPGQNVPFPQFDRSRTGASKVLPIELDKILDPSGNPNAAIGEQGARASGAVFSVGFNFYKFIMDSHHGWGDPKPYEKIFPRALKDASSAYRMYDEGRERGSQGGPNSADTIVPYDRHDTEHMMEIVGKALGYQPMRQSEKWGQIMAQAEVEKFYHSKRIGLMEQFSEMVAADNAKGREDVRQAIVVFNGELPDWAKGQAISSDNLHQSIESRMKAKVARESGVPVKESDVGIARHVQGLYPGAVVDVRKVR